MPEGSREAPAGFYSLGWVLSKRAGDRRGGYWNENDHTGILLYMYAGASALLDQTRALYIQVR